jgi:hypothetical protein
MIQSFAIAIVTIAFSFSAGANENCPDFNGDYNCKSYEGENFDIGYSTTVNEAKVKIYELTTFGLVTTIIADGELHTYKEGGDTIEYVAFCPPTGTGATYLRIVSRLVEENVSGEVQISYNSQNVLTMYAPKTGDTFTCTPKAIR